MVIKYITGHKSPDTDCTCSSIVYGEYLTQKGVKNKVIKQGDLNNETKFVLERFGVSEPETVTKLEEGSQLILMDHNEANQSIDNRDKYIVSQVIDHHKFDFSVKDPLFIRAEPIGSTCSIVAKMFFEENLEISRENASLLVSSILSDTLNFRSPTTTKEDIELVGKLNDIAQIENLDKYSLEMFAAKSDLGDMSIEKLVKLDYKEFNFNGKKYGVGVMETTDPNYGLNREDEIVAELRRIKETDSLDGTFLSIIDILNEKNTTIIPDEDVGNLLKEVFGGVVNGNLVDLGRALSRKKQIIPKLEAHFQ